MTEVTNEYQRAVDNRRTDTPGKLYYIFIDREGSSMVNYAFSTPDKFEAFNQLGEIGGEHEHRGLPVRLELTNFANNTLAVLEVV